MYAAKQSLRRPTYGFPRSLLLNLLRAPLWEGEGGHKANIYPKHNDPGREVASSPFLRH